MDSELVQEHILAPLAAWATELKELKDSGKVCDNCGLQLICSNQSIEKEKCLLDHYEDKLVELRQEGDRRRAKGKVESQKEIDRFQRNVGNRS